MRPFPPLAAACAAAVFLAAPCAPFARGAVLERTAKDTLTAVELDPGDALRFTLRNGQVRTLVLEETSAAILERVVPGGIVYHFTCRVRIDGHAMTMERYACTQESFYEPYVVNGLRIWFDSVADTFQKIPIRYPKTGNLDAHPHKRARFAVQDATLSICPEEMRPWLPRSEDRIDVGECYNGDDCWMGPYLGEACHVGLDINHRKGDPLWAPIDFDDQWFFQSLKAGDNNNRWRGLRRWPNGDLWALQSHHLIELLVPEHAPLRGGTKYATTAGVAVGSHQHTHFEFKVVQPGGKDAAPEKIDFDDTKEKRPLVIHLDPWIVFRQIFEDGRRRRGEFMAAMTPLTPGRTGKAMQFAADDGSRDESGKRQYYWSFGDGGWATGATPAHVFARPGIYPITLVVADGGRLATQTQHVTVDGAPQSLPCFALTAPDEPAFRPRPVHAMDVYGDPVRFVPHTLEFTGRAGRPRPQAKTIELQNLGGGRLPAAKTPRIEYMQGKDWLKVALREDDGRQSLQVSADATALAAGTYAAIVRVDCPGAVNSPQGFRVVLNVPAAAPPKDVVVDDRDAGFYATPYFWVGHRFCNCKQKGYGGFYRSNGGRAVEGEFARFTPDLRAGTYRVAFRGETPFQRDADFDVRVRHRSGEKTVRVRPAESRTIGTFAFDEGTEGFVEIRAGQSKGLVVADAVEFVASDSPR